jgi:hypothetical protein
MPQNKKVEFKLIEFNKINKNVYSGVDKIITVNRLSALGVTNINGYTYEQKSLNKAINEFIKGQSNILLWETEEEYQKIDSINIDPEKVIGTCTEINEDHVKFIISKDRISKFNKLKQPIALLRMAAEVIDQENKILKIKSIRAVDIKEMGEIYEYKNK